MILDCQNISKAFGTNVILDNVSFHLEDKEKMAIVGINGAGKTTLLKIIMQEEEADSGQIVLSKDRTIGAISDKADDSAWNSKSLSHPVRLFQRKRFAGQEKMPCGMRKKLRATRKIWISGMKLKHMYIK